MSSDDGTEYTNHPNTINCNGNGSGSVSKVHHQYHQHNHHHHQSHHLSSGGSHSSATSSAQTGTQTIVPINCGSGNVGTGTISCNSSNRRNSSIVYSSQSSSHGSVTGNTNNGTGNTNNAGTGTIKDDVDILNGGNGIDDHTSVSSGQAKSMHMVGVQCNGGAGNYATIASPSRIIGHGGSSVNENGFNLGARLSIHPDRYDENISRCLPPPSPAPNSDRFVMGIPCPSPSAAAVAATTAQHYQDSKFAIVQHRSMSPSSRYRSSMSDRFRDISPKCDRFVPPSHYLANSTPLASDSYTYLSATVHTPVKRYVPTPPPPTEIYSEPSSIASGFIAGSHLPQQQSTNQQQSQATSRNHSQTATNTLPYRYRMKCCSSEPSSIQQQQQQQQQQQHIHSSSDGIEAHYATPPRVRPIKCPQSQNTVSTTSGTGTSAQQQSASPALASSSTTSSGGGGNLNRQIARNCPGEYIQRTPSVEYIGPTGSRVMTPVSGSGSDIGASTGTCLHCSTIRRTTGVHQMTQTTGPISPVPQQQSISISSAASSHSDVTDQQSSISSSSPPASSSILSLQQQQQQSSQQNVQQNQQQSQQQPTSPIQHNQQVSQDDQHLVSKQIQIGQHHGSQQQAQYIQSHTGTRQLHQHQQQSQHHQQQQQQSQQQLNANADTGNGNNVLIGSTLTLQRSTNGMQQQQNQQMQQQNQQLQQQPLRHQQIQHQQHMSRKQRIKEYMRRELATFFGVDCCTEEHERSKWADRQKRLAIRRFGQLKSDADLIGQMGYQHQQREQQGDRPDILPAQTTDETELHRLELEHRNRLLIERKASVPTMIWNGIAYMVQILSKNQPRPQRQWSRSFPPCHMAINDETPGDMFDGLTPLQENEVFFDSPNNVSAGGVGGAGGIGGTGNGGGGNMRSNSNQIDQTRQLYIGERVHGWRTRAGTDHQTNGQRFGYRGTRISSQLLDGVLDNSRRPIVRGVKLLRTNELDDRYDHRPYFTYWINTVQVLVLLISLICYGVGPIGIGMEQKSGQVLVTSLSLQQVQHQEPRNVWIGPRVDDLVHLGAKFAACMRRDTKIMDVISKTRRQERETACCIRNDDSGCVQSSQADCSVRGLWPTKSISTWKKWSPGESGPGGRISGSVCGLDPKYCDAPASVAPYEWPDDITKWPICRKTNSFSQRFRFKDHTAEHMVCEVIGHPCCTGVYGECRITTREFCDFVSGYFHEEASLCSQVSCLNDVCGMFPFISPEVPDQFYRLFTSLCLHAGILHLAITVAFQHVFLADLERLIGPIRTSIVYIGSGVAGNLTSAIFLPYKPEVGPLASLAGVVASLLVLLVLIHWKQLKKPHIALMKLMLLVGLLFSIGTLPWQQNFIGLIAGLVFGTVLTLSLVPFVSITKYGRHSKINLIWTCMLLHFAIYTAMLIIFYIFPMIIHSIGLGSDGINIGNNEYSNGYSFGGNMVSCDKGICSGISPNNGPTVADSSGMGIGISGAIGSITSNGGDVGDGGGGGGGSIGGIGGINSIGGIGGDGTARLIGTGGGSGAGGSTDGGTLTIGDTNIDSGGHSGIGDIVRNNA